MKKFPVILAMMVALFPMLGALSEAAPQTRQDTISMEGAQETITMTLYESERGYRLWYDANMFAFVPADEGSDVDTFKPVSPDAANGVSLSINYSSQSGYTLENAGQDVQKSLQENGYTVTAADTNEIFPSYQSLGFHGEKGSSFVDKYIVAAEEGQYYITVEYPSEAAEGFGSRLHYIVSTFEIMGADKE